MSIPSYTRKGRKFWRVDETIRDSDGERNRVRQSGFTTKEDARRYLHKAVRAGKHEKKEISVTDAIETYLHAKDYPSKPSDVSRSRHIIKAFPARRLTSLTLGDIDLYRKLRLDVGAKPATMDKEVEFLIRATRYVLECRMIRFNPLAAVKPLGRPNTRDTVVTQAEIDSIIDALEGKAKLAVLIAYKTGMRLMEVLSLKWNQIEFTSYCCYITVQATNTKTGKTRVIPVVDKAVLRLLLEAKSDSPYVFEGRNGNHLTSVRRPFKAACKQSGALMWFHDLRRLFTTEKRREGVPESVIMKITGHTTNSAFTRYSAVDPSDMLKAVGYGVKS
jgi:integrase